MANRQLPPPNTGGERSPRGYPYGLHFNRVPESMRNAHLEELFNDFGNCRIMRDPGSPYGWVGFASMDICNDAFESLRVNEMGMNIRKGPYGQSPFQRPPMAGLYPPAYGMPMPPPRHYLPMNYYDDYYDDYYPNIPYAYDDMYSNRLDREVGPCMVCATRTSYSCERCGAFYCNERCQRMDWSNHQKECDRNMPALNFGNRRRPGQADVRDLGERVQRLPIADGSEEGDPGTPAPLGARLALGERRRDNEDPSPEGFNRRQNDGRRDDFDRRSGEGRGDAPSDGRHSENPPSDRRPNEYQRRPDGNRDGSGGGFERRGPGGGYDRRPNDRRRNDGQRPENGFQHRNEDRNGFQNRNEDRNGSQNRNEDRNGFQNRNEDRNGFQNRNEDRNGFQNRNEDRNGFQNRNEDRGDRRPMSERRNENGFGARRDNDRRPGGNDRRNFDGEVRSGGAGEGRTRSGEGRVRFEEKRPVSETVTSVSLSVEKPKENTPILQPCGVPNVAAAVPMKSPRQKVDDDKTNELSPDSEPVLLPVENGTCVALKNNDEVVVTFAASTDAIHVAPPDNSQQFVAVMIGLMELKKVAKPLERAPGPKEVVACQYNLDENYYRAVVKDVLPDGEYMMEFCDYGNVQKSKLNQLRALPTTLKVCPRNAVKVSLRGVVAVPVRGDVEKLLSEMSDKEVKLKVQYDGDMTKGVELFKPDGQSLNKEIIALIGEASAPEKKECPAPKETSTPEKKETPTPEKTAPREEVASASSPSQAGAKPRSADYVLSLLKKANQPAPAPAPASSPLPAEEGVCVCLNDGDTVNITTSNSTGCIYITPVLSATSEFVKLIQRLNEHCKSAPSLKREPREKEVVACVFTLDGMYYRVAVEEALPNGEYNMIFCDYGNTQKCKTDDLKAIPDDLKRLPRNAVKVYLRDVDPVPVSGAIGDAISVLTDNAVELKLRYQGSIANGVELILPGGESLNEILRGIIAENKPRPAAAPAVEEATEEDLSPMGSLPLPSNKPFPFLIFAIIEDDDYLVAGCDASAEEVKQMENGFADTIAVCASNTTELEHRPKVGQMCLAKYEDSWYRALATEVLEDGAYKVFFLDYGNTSTATPQNIRKITQELRERPHIATLCKVNGVAETSDNWAKIKAHIQKSIDVLSAKLCQGTTAKMTGSSTADVTIPELKELF